MKEVQQAEALAAIKTLQHLGYSYHGAEMWKPPIGKKPNFDLLDTKGARIAELEAELEAVGAGGVQRLAIAPQPCSRSHPHEEMTPMCELRTEIARLTNALARAEAQLAAAPQAVTDEREAFEAWLGIKPCGAAHDFGWAAWKSRAALATTQAAKHP